MNSQKNLKLKSSFETLPSLYKKYEAEAKFNNIIGRNRHLMVNLEQGILLPGNRAQNISTLSQLPTTESRLRDTQQNTLRLNHQESSNNHRSALFRNYSRNDKNTLAHISNMKSEINIRDNKFMKSELKLALTRNNNMSQSKIKQNFLSLKALPQRHNFNVSDVSKMETGSQSQAATPYDKLNYKYAIQNSGYRIIKPKGLDLAKLKKKASMYYNKKETNYGPLIEAQIERERGRLSSLRKNALMSGLKLGHGEEFRKDSIFPGTSSETSEAISLGYEYISGIKNKIDVSRNSIYLAQNTAPIYRKSDAIDFNGRNNIEVGKGFRVYPDKGKFVNQSILNRIGNATDLRIPEELLIKSQEYFESFELKRPSHNSLESRVKPKKFDLNSVRKLSQNLYNTQQNSQRLIDKYREGDFSKNYEITTIPNYTPKPKRSLKRQNARELGVSQKDEENQETFTEEQDTTSEFEDDDQPINQDIHVSNSVTKDIHIKDIHISNSVTNKDDNQSNQKEEFYATFSKNKEIDNRRIVKNEKLNSIQLINFDSNSNDDIKKEAKFAQLNFFNQKRVESLSFQPQLMGSEGLLAANRNRKMNEGGSNNIITNPNQFSTYHEGKEQTARGNMEQTKTSPQTRISVSSKKQLSLMESILSQQQEKKNAQVLKRRVNFGSKRKTSKGISKHRSLKELKISENLEEEDSLYEDDFDSSREDCLNLNLVSRALDTIQNSFEGKMSTLSASKMDKVIDIAHNQSRLNYSLDNMKPEGTPKSHGIKLKAFKLPKVKNSTIDKRNLDNISKLVVKQNKRNNEVIRNLDEKVKVEAQSVMSLDDQNHLTPQIIKMIKEGMSEQMIDEQFLKATRNELKALNYKTSQTVCSLVDFHIKLNMNPPRDDVDDATNIPLISNFIDITPNNQYHCKLNIRGQVSPIRLKIDYFDLDKKRNLNNIEMKQIKGYINIFLSKIHRNPKPAQLGEVTHELAFEQTVPPKSIDIHSNEKKIPQIPFFDEWLYITIECGEYDKINDLELNIKASPYSTLKKQKRDTSYDNNQLIEFNIPEKKSSQSITQFRSEVGKLIDNLVNYRGEWQDFKDEMTKKRLEKQNRRMIDTTFITTLSDEPEGEATLHWRSNLEQFLQMAYEAKDYVKANMLAAQYFKFDKAERHQKAQVLNLERDQKTWESQQRRDIDFMNDLKRKHFIVHKNEILKMKRQEMKKEQREVFLKKTQLIFLLRLISVSKVMRRVWENFQILKKRREAKVKFQYAILLTSALYYRKLRRRGQNYKNRGLGLIKRTLTLQTLIPKIQIEKRAMEIFKHFHVTTIEFKMQIQQFMRFQKAGSNIRKIIRFHHNLQKTRIQTIKRRLFQFKMEFATTNLAPPKGLTTKQKAALKEKQGKFFRFNDDELLYKFAESLFLVKKRLFQIQDDWNVRHDHIKELERMEQEINALNAESVQQKIDENEDPEATHETHESIVGLRENLSDQRMYHERMVRVLDGKLQKRMLHYDQLNEFLGWKEKPKKKTEKEKEKEKVEKQKEKANNKNLAKAKSKKSIVTNAEDEIFRIEEQAEKLGIKLGETPSFIQWAPVSSLFNELIETAIKVHEKQLKEIEEEKQRQKMINLKEEEENGLGEISDSLGDPQSPSYDEKKRRAGGSVKKGSISGKIVIKIVEEVEE